jgi:hypothetical protein
MPFTNPYLYTSYYQKPHAPNRRFCNSYLIRIAFNERAITNDSNRSKDGVIMSRHLPIR